MAQNSGKIPLEEMTLRQLRLVASEYEVSRYSRMRKPELVEAIRTAQAARKSGNPSSTVAGVTSAVADVRRTPNYSLFDLATVDDGFGYLPGGYGKSRIVLMPCDSEWAYAYWDIPGPHKEEMRRQGGICFALRFYDVTNIDINSAAPHSLQQYECDEMAREWFLSVPVSDRDYIVELGYVADDGRWLVMTRSAPIHVPKAYRDDIPKGTGPSPITSRDYPIQIKPIDTNWLYICWHAYDNNKLQELSDKDFKLRLHDATNIDIIYQAPHDIQEYRCYELATEWYLPISETQRDYVVELGYKNENDYWIALTRSTHTRSKSIATSRADTKSSNLESKEGTVNSYVVVPEKPR